MRPGLLMRSEGFAGPQTRGPGGVDAAFHAASGLQGDLTALEDQCRRLQLLIAELLRKNQELRDEVGWLRCRHADSMDVV